MLKRHLFFMLPLILCSACWYGEAFAGCIRKIQVSLAPTGLSVISNGSSINGIYPEILEGMTGKDGCQFEMRIVPRARLELLFENGQADLLIPAIRTSRRDEFGIFVPLVYTRATLISINPNRPPITSLQELLEQKQLKLAVVRGYDYGDAYQQVLQDMQKAGRLIVESDPVSVARMMRAGVADITLMAPYIFTGAVQIDKRVDDILDKLRYEPVAEIGWADSGVYLSKKSLTPEDRATLQSLFENAAKSGMVWKGFQRYYKTEVLKEGSRPR
ncbi:MAG: substrate-binding periplasmic protein [Undibacterium curvum]|uniref:substrate-binding periplasmic protein n=1 Tax=Undibacterium curvum TaxID=2762294 RepID=UPI003BD51383